MRLPDWLKTTEAQLAIAALSGILAVLGLTIVVERDDDGTGPAKDTVTISVGKPTTSQGAAGPVEPTKIDVPRQALEQAKRSEVGDHDGLKGEVPDGVPRAELEAGREQQERLAESDQLPIVTPDAAPSQRGCTTRLVANFSSRRGVRPRLLVAHYTVSPNRAGWGDVWAIAGLFDRPSFAASSHYVIDSEGHCAYIVRESDKAWTQAAANPLAISIEVINSGREGRLAAAAGLAKIGQVFADAGKRWGIPLQAGAVRGCTVTRPGIVDHRALGACGGGHVDVSPYSPATVVAATRAAAGGAGVSSAPADVQKWCARSSSSDADANRIRRELVRQRGYVCTRGVARRRYLSRTDRVTCRKLSWWRTREPRPGGDAGERAVIRRKALQARGVVCTTKGPRLRR